MAKQVSRHISRHECFCLVNWYDMIWNTWPHTLHPHCSTACLHWYQSRAECAYFGKTRSKTQYTNFNHQIRISIFLKHNRDVSSQN